MPDSKSRPREPSEWLVRSQLHVVASCASHLESNADDLMDGKTCVANLFIALYGLSLRLLPVPDKGGPGSEVHRRAMALIPEPRSTQHYLALLSGCIDHVREHASSIADGNEVADDLSVALADLRRVAAERAGSSLQ